MTIQNSISEKFRQEYLFLFFNSYIYSFLKNSCILKVEAATYEAFKIPSEFICRSYPNSSKAIYTCIARFQEIFL
jgi:hypothetical protein